MMNWQLWEFLSTADVVSILRLKLKIEWKTKKTDKMRSFLFLYSISSIFVSVIKRFYQSLGNDDSGLLSPL